MAIGLRLVIGVLGAVAVGLFSSHRSSLSVAIVSMAKYNSSAKGVSDDSDEGQCWLQSGNHGNSSSQNSNPIIRGEFDWSESLQVCFSLSLSDKKINLMF